MKRILLLIILFRIMLSVAAGETLKFDAYSLMRFGDYKQASRSDNRITAFVRLEAGKTLDAGDYEIVRHHGDIALVRGTVYDFEQLAEQPQVLEIAFERPVKLANDLAASYTGAMSVAQGLNGARGYTGKGVVVGLFDCGFDFNNPSFKDKDGNSRIERIFWYYKDDGSCSVYDNPEAMLSIETNNRSETHGTHVLGTIAGYTEGEVKIAVPGGHEIGDASRFAGMAKDASIVIAHGMMSDANIYDGVARMIEYAKSTGRPCVINLSLSDILGPHDGSDAFATAMSELGKEAVIVMSAGNYVGQGASITHHFTEAAPVTGTYVWPIWWRDDCEGAMTVWAADERPLQLYVHIDEARIDENLTIEYVNPKLGNKWHMRTSDILLGDGIASKEFNMGFKKSHIWIYPQMSPSGRHGYYIEFDLHIRNEEKSRYIAPAFEIKGEPGQRADIYISSDYGQMRRLWHSDYADGRDDMSVSSMACGEGLVCVGAWTLRKEWPSLDGRMVSAEENKSAEGDIADFSSFGVLLDGRSLPHVAAPGSGVISAYSTLYHNSYPTQDFYSISAEGNIGGHDCYWTAMYGTSMSAPVVAGSIAQWLEAYPDLTSMDVLEIIAESSTVDEAVHRNPVRWGAGKFNAAEGLRRVLERSTAVSGPSVDIDAEPVFVIGNGELTVMHPGASAVECAIYDMTGQLILRRASEGSMLTVHTDGLSGGIYIARCGVHSRKIAINVCR